MGNYTVKFGKSWKHRGDYDFVARMGKNATIYRSEMFTQEEVIELIRAYEQRFLGDKRVPQKQLENLILDWKRDERGN